MSSQFLTFIFMIFVSIQLSSCGWYHLLSGGKKELATEKTTEKSFKDDEPNSSPAVIIDNSVWPPPKELNDLSSDKVDSKGSSSVSVSSSTIPSSLENSIIVVEWVGNFSEFITPEVTYAPNEKDISSWIDEEKEPTSNDQEIGRKDKETHSTRNVTDEPDYSTQKTTTENYESGNSSTDTTNTPTITENTLNSSSKGNVARNVITGIESYDNVKKSGALVGSGSTGSFFVNFTLNFCIFLGDLLLFNSSFT